MPEEGLTPFTYTNTRKQNFFSHLVDVSLNIPKIPGDSLSGNWCFSKQGNQTD